MIRRGGKTGDLEGKEGKRKERKGVQFVERNTKSRKKRKKKKFVVRPHNTHTHIFSRVFLRAKAIIH